MNDYKKIAIQLCDAILDTPCGCDACPLKDTGKLNEDGDRVCELHTKEESGNQLRHGHWIDMILETDHKAWVGRYECSRCGERTRHSWYNYCPFCGAEMEEVVE